MVDNLKNNDIWAVDGTFKVVCEPFFPAFHYKFH